MKRMDLIRPEPCKIESLEGNQLNIGPLLNECFGIHRGCHFFDDFPVWDPKLGLPSPSRQFANKWGEQWVSCCSVRVVRVSKFEGEAIKIAMIGAVATHPEFRGRGLASTNILNALDWSITQGAQQAILWTSEEHFYNRLGFTPYGVQCRIPLAELLQHIGSDSRHHGVLAKCNPGWTPALYELICTRSSGACLQPSDQRWFEAHKNVHWWYTGSSEHPTSYAAIGRGIDLGGIIHEWGGNKNDLINLLTHINAIRSGLELLGHPKLFEELGSAPVAAQRCEPMCLGKNLSDTSVVDPHSFWIWGLDAG